MKFFFGSSTISEATNSPAERGFSSSKAFLVFTRLLLVAAWILLLAYHLRIISFHYSYMPFESSMLFQAWQILHGVNPYSFAEHPVSANLYGCLMPEIGVLAAKWG